MDAESTAQIISMAVGGFVDTHDEYRKVVTSSSPLKRPVDIRTSTWRPWLTEGGRAGSSSYVGPIDPERAAIADRLLADLPGLDREHHGSGADRRMDRAQLVTLAEAAAKRGKQHERRCIALWVASMMWGAGTVNGRGPWRTAHGLASENLGAVLVESHRAIRAGELDEAYVAASAIAGSGEAAFTRWLWAAALDTRLPLQPLVLDGPGRNGFETALDDTAATRSRLGTGRVAYAWFVESLNLTAAELRTRPGFKGTTPEKVAWLLSEQW
ncbi:MAG: hypothetical protein U0Q22_06385 [Acidimicrobiales bacterium]